MSDVKKRAYRKKSGALITAVQLNLDTTGFIYHKWGEEQHCKAGDWLVDNQGDCYSIDREAFEDTYQQRSPGVYQKTSVVWAEVATAAGTVVTREGGTEYRPGDYIVYNKADGSDNYAVSKAKFEEIYELAEDDLR